MHNFIILDLQLLEYDYFGFFFYYRHNPEQININN